jgi:hypothetical protein
LGEEVVEGFAVGFEGGGLGAGRCDGDEEGEEKGGEAAEFHGKYRVQRRAGWRSAKGV